MDGSHNCRSLQVMNLKMALPSPTTAVSHRKCSRPRESSWGPRLDLLARLDPSLASFEELQGPIRDHLLTEAASLLCLVEQDGYRLVRPGPETDPPIPASPGVLELSRQIDRESLSNLGLGGVLQSWRLFLEFDERMWERDPDFYHVYAERLRGMGEPLLAYDVTSEGLRRWPVEVRLHRLEALTLAHCGAFGEAIRRLERLKESGHEDEETLSTLAHVYEEIWAQGGSSHEEYLGRAHELFLMAYGQAGRTQYAMKAATTALLQRNHSFATALAIRVQEICLGELLNIERAGGDSFSTLSTLGLAAVVLENLGEARRWFTRAGQVGRSRYRDLANLRREVRSLLRQVQEDSTRMDDLLPIPRVVVFAGHALDLPGDLPRFAWNSRLEEAIQDELRSRLSAHHGLIGYSSARCGSEILFLEAVERIGGETVVVLPLAPDEFNRERVDPLRHRSWRDRYEQVLKRATKVITTSRHRLRWGGLGEEFAHRCLLGLAQIHSDQLSTELLGLVLWDGQMSAEPGDIWSQVENFRHIGLEVDWIDLAGLRSTILPDRTFEVVKPPSVRQEENELQIRIMSLLFADVVNYTKIEEDRIPQFLEHFLGVVARVAEEFQPQSRATWGDGLHFVFQDTRTAGLFALALTETVLSTSWIEFGLPAGLNLRTALHVGPVYQYVNAVTRESTYAGSHVSRTARLEPVTPPGTVYSTQEFAALANFEEVREFFCEYAGQVELAKGFGAFPVYHVRRRTPHGAHHPVTSRAPA